MAHIGQKFAFCQVCRFCVFAPQAESVAVVLGDDKKRTIPLKKNEYGYFEGIADQVEIGDLYVYRLDGERDRPDQQEDLGSSRCALAGTHRPVG